MTTTVGLQHSTSNLVSPLLNDLYQITMAYGYWIAGKHEEHSVFELYFRKNPFGGEYTVFAGLEECILHMETFHFSDSDIEYLKSILSHCEVGFFDWLRQLDCSKIKVRAPKEGTVMFPHVPLIQIEGPIAVVQLLETTLLNLVNFPSLIATNAARHRYVAGKKPELFEFGLRRAQGPDGGVSASRYSYLGGFDGTSNVIAGKLFGIPLRGTHAHSFVTAFQPNDGTNEFLSIIHDSKGTQVPYWPLIMKCREELGFLNTNLGELASFATYAKSFPSSALLLVDTYDTLESGVLNFLIVAYAMHKLGFRATGIRLDSGDLAYLSKRSREIFVEVANKLRLLEFQTFQIVASNDLNVSTIESLNQQGHSIDIFGVGTHLVTCQAQPALGCVYKLVELNGIPRMKLSQEISKVTLPGKKVTYRLWGSESDAVVDLMMLSDEPTPKIGDRILCRHPFTEHKRVYVLVTRVEKISQVCFKDGKRSRDLGTLASQREWSIAQVAAVRRDHLRTLNPTPYKVSVSVKLYDLLHELWLESTTVPEI